MSKKKNKIKKRRHLSRKDIFRNKLSVAERELIKEDVQLAWMYESLKNRFPDEEERLAYINSLIEGLENEPEIPVGEFKND